MHAAKRKENYDFIGEGLKDNPYPSLHKYPATMIPQIGIEILNELNIKAGRMLDPYCGSGSSFAAGLEVGIKHFVGFDLNPLAILISKARFTPLKSEKLSLYYRDIEKSLKRVIDQNIEDMNWNGLEYWFDKETLCTLSLIKNKINAIKDSDIRDFFLVALSTTTRKCSYTKINEFKLYRMKKEKLLEYKPDVKNIFLRELLELITIHKSFYKPRLNDIVLHLSNSEFSCQHHDQFDVVLTSPPYGDSRTTVAYGQFSLFTNRLVLDRADARKIDTYLMGGKKTDKNGLVNGTEIGNYIKKIGAKDIKRAREVDSFYIDLGMSIGKIAHALKRGGTAIYVVGNRTVKGYTLPTDQFIAHTFEKNGFDHVFTYERIISNKSMPLKNSPSNITGETCDTINKEFIIVCRKK